MKDRHTRSGKHGRGGEAAERRQPLPWQTPKPEQDDPGATARVRAVLDSPAYLPADEDMAFYRRGETRGVRLQMDYMKAELLLREHGVHDTIVVFGSTRLCEPATALRNVETLRAALARDPDNADTARRLAIAERIHARSHFYDIAREFGRLAGDACARGDGAPAVIMTGGGPGIMEAANRGAFDAGAQTVGLNISLPHEQYPNPYVTPGLCFSFHYFALRKLHFLQRARALVVFPGGYGTLDELFEVLTLMQTRKIELFPVVLVGETHWRAIIDFEALVDEGLIDPEDRELFWFAETAGEIWASIRRWNETNARAPSPRG